MAEAKGTEHFAARPEFPNFDYIRLFAASLVLFSHSFFIADNSDANEPLVRLLGEGEIFGIYGVCIFFVISGFLVTMSARTRGTVTAFVASRALRVFPGLFVCQLVTATVLGVFFTRAGIAHFLGTLIPLKYAIHYTLDPAMSWQVWTVVFYDDPKGTGLGLNGSLWTIQQELWCYVIVATLMATRLLRWPFALGIVLLTLPFLTPWNKDDVTIPLDALFAGFEAVRPLSERLADFLYIDGTWEQRVTDFFWVAPSFFMGSIIYFVWEWRGRLPAWPLLLCAVDFVWAVHRGHTYDHFALYGAYPLLRLAVATEYRLPSLKKFGDISYGIYLYGWPCQQAVRGFLGPGVTWPVVFVLAGIGASLCAYASWHLVERPALRLKRHFAPRREKPLTTVDAPGLATTESA